MRWYSASPFLASAVVAHLNWQVLHPELAARQIHQGIEYVSAGEKLAERQTQQPQFLSASTQKFAINGSGIPEVDFDVGESYAGLLPISGNDTSNQLYYWFFPSTNPVASANKEILIWLTGGPGCSSVGELLQENGPFLWQPGVFKPFANKWSWHHLTNVVWVDQPIGSGFSQGTVTAKDEQDVARQFLGFWKNFVDTFALQGYKVYVTGSSYSGMYTPYISSAMLDANDTTYYNLTGMMIFDGLYSKEPLMTDIPVAAFVDQWKDVFAFNDTFTQNITSAADKCGYTDYLKKYLVFPPVGVQPAELPGQVPGQDGTYMDGCSSFIDVYLAAQEINPCFSPYEIPKRCPIAFDPLGFAEGTMYSPAGSGPVYFDRADVKAAINAPVNTTWQFCATNPVFVNGTDNSVLEGPGSQPVIPHVIDKTQNVIIGHGSQDFVLIADGTLLTIQNMTWGGKMGFQERPTAPLYIPYHANDDPTTFIGAGVIGTSHSERGLTYVGVAPAGHFLTMDQPAVAFRGLEILLGRVDSFQSTAPFTTDTNKTVQPNVAMGNGTVFEGFVDTSVTTAMDGLNSNGTAQAVTSTVATAGTSSIAAYGGSALIAVGSAVLMAML
ncbi:carboxypeptidase [Diplogelasinospora grovesii]|uniref:Carboxypeptidase n=1 Tax=Diplogelasinospora grovesii TaxID=303347 RepID=A0AAN6MZX8_9PEZI|nr:carboxypeptidase [Diplogelasinospora grovesii]